MEPTNDQQIPLPPLALGNEPHHDYSAFFDNAEFPKAQRKILARREARTTNPPGMDQVLGFFTGKVSRKGTDGRFHYTWEAAPLLLTGSAGKAKTTIACDIADRVARCGFKVFYSDAHEMHRRYRHPALEIDAFEEQFLTTRVLVLDNFENLMPAQEGDLMSWVKRRTDNLRWTILIADLAKDAPMSAQVIECFAAKGKVIHFR